MNGKLILSSGLFLTSLLYLTGCGETNSNSVSVSPAVTTTPTVTETVPSVTTSPVVQSTVVANPNTPAPTTSLVKSTTKLAAGTYCYSAQTKTLDAQAKINISSTNQVSGKVQAVIQNPAESYYTSYNQTFTGQLNGDQAKLNIVTKIEDDTQNQQQTWTITASNLKTDRETFVKVDCAKLNAKAENPTENPTENPATTAPVRVKFAKGANSTIIKNSVVRGDRDTYVLGAKQGQQMNLKISSLENNAVFDAIAPNGQTLTSATTTWNGQLPANGDYQIIVGGTRGNTTYELTIEIK